MQTIEQLAAKIKIERDAIAKHQKALVALHDRYTKMVKAKAAEEPLTLESAMNVYIGDTRVDFEAGRHFIEKMNRSEWHKSGLTFTGGHWAGNHQRILTLILDYRFGEAEMTRLEALVREVLPVMKTETRRDGNPVMIGNSCKAAPIDYNTLKVFDTLTHDCGENVKPALGVLPDGSAIVFDQYRPKWGLEKTGTIAECLEHLREHNWYEGGEHLDDLDRD